MKHRLNLFIDRVIVEATEDDAAAEQRPERLEADLRATLAARLAGGLPARLTRSAERLQAQTSGASGSDLASAILSARPRGDRS